MLNFGNKTGLGLKWKTSKKYQGYRKNWKFKTFCYFMGSCKELSLTDRRLYFFPNPNVFHINKVKIKMYVFKWYLCKTSVLNIIPCQLAKLPTVVFSLALIV